MQPAVVAVGVDYADGLQIDVYKRQVYPGKLEQLQPGLLHLGRHPGMQAALFYRLSLIHI